MRGDLPATDSSRFPRTRATFIGELTGGDEAARTRAAETLAAVYWRPIHSHLRYRWQVDPDTAEDLTQEFLARALAAEAFARYDPAKARFRTFVRVCVDRYMLNQRRSAARIKRGGGRSAVPLDDWIDGAGGEATDGAGMGAGYDAGAEAAYEARFHQEWVRSVFTLAVRALEDDCRRRGRSVQFALFEAYDLHDADAGDRPTYAALAEAQGLPVTQVTNHLAAARRRFRELALATLAELCASEAEYRAEARALLGIEIP